MFYIRMFLPSALALLVSCGLVSHTTSAGLRAGKLTYCWYRLQQLITVLQLNPRFSTSMYVKAAAIMLTMAGSAYVAFFGTESYAVRPQCAAVVLVALFELLCLVLPNTMHVYATSRGKA